MEWRPVCKSNRRNWLSLGQPLSIVFFSQQLFSRRNGGTVTWFVVGSTLCVTLRRSFVKLNMGSNLLRELTFFRTRCALVWQLRNSASMSTYFAMSSTWYDQAAQYRSNNLHSYRWKMWLCVHRTALKNICSQSVHNHTNNKNRNDQTRREYTSNHRREWSSVTKVKRFKREVHPCCPSHSVPSQIFQSTGRWLSPPARFPCRYRLHLQ